MKRHASRSILFTLFLPFSALFIIAFLLIAAFFVSSETKRIHNDTFLSIETELNSILNEADQMVSELNTSSQHVVYSNLLKKHFARYLDAPKNTLPQEYHSYDQNTKSLYDLLVSIIGPGSSVDQLYLYGLSGGSYGVGKDNTASSLNVKELSWYSHLKETHGESYIFLDKDLRLAQYGSLQESSYFLTLCRKYYNYLNVPQGVIEVKKSILPLINKIQSFHQIYHESFYLYTPEGAAVYPLPDSQSEESSPHAKYYTILSDSSVSEQPFSDSRIKTTASQYLIYQTSPVSGFTCVAVIDRTYLLRPTRNYIISAFFLLLLVCLATVVLSYTIAKRISDPLGQIYSQLSAFDLTGDNLAKQEFPEINTSIIELDGLYRAFLHMQTQARTSLSREIELQNQEMQSRMLALQAQMNPHFLYNSLATIQALADEGITDSIYELCQNISDILRYISSDSNQLVSLSAELTHTISYLECMKLRYNDQLSYTIEIPDSMLEIQIPKLCLQLIVENAIKFTTQKRSPWRICIDGHHTDYDWEIHISDNGPGFSQDMLDTLMQKIQAIDETGVLPNLEISGMGLMNIYIRFKLLYQGQHIFRLSNCIPEGARVTIGGVLLP